ncbi:MAG: Ig-like domain-containing protein [Chloroflexi bacterium]|nr:Ig-like domain-containing protein [Chloroflexota bacterium]
MRQDSLRWRLLYGARRFGLVGAGKVPIRKAALVLALLLSNAIPFQSAQAAAAPVTITGPAEVTGAAFEVTVIFSEGVTGFAQSDVTVGNGSATGFTADSATVYRVTIAPTAGYNGSVTVDVPAGVAQSISDNANNLTATQFSTTATFASACTTGSAVSDPTNNAGLVADCAALLAGEDTLKGTATLNWDANTSIFSWDGISVGSTPQRVLNLALINKALNGAIPAQLGNLSALTWLLMPDNRLSGSIPAELGKLTNVQYLWLHCNQFTGTIPYSLGALTALSGADFRGNQLTGGIPASMAGLPVKLNEGIACAGAQPGGTTTDNSRSNRPPRLTVTLTCPPGPLTEGDTLRCTLTLKNAGGQTLTNITWRLPTLAIGPQMLPTGWPWERPGELEPGRSIRMKLAYGPLSPRRDAAGLALSQVLGDGTTTQPTRMAVPWPASLPLTVIADSQETVAATVTHVVDVRALAPGMLLTLGEPETETADEASVEDEVGVRDEVSVKATAGPPSTALLRVELRRSQDPASDGQMSHYTLVITNASRYRWLTGLHWRIPSLRIRRQVGDLGWLPPASPLLCRYPPSRQSLAGNRQYPL